MSSKSFLRQILHAFSNFSRHFQTFSSFSSGLSQSFPRFSPTEIKFRRTFSILRGKKSEKCPLKSHEQRVVLSQPTDCFAKTREFLAKLPETCDFQTRWESRISQQLFLSSKSRVKWKGVIWEVLLKVFPFAGKEMTFIFCLRKSVCGGGEVVLLEAGCWLDLGTLCRLGLCSSSVYRYFINLQGEKNIRNA